MIDALRGRAFDDKFARAECRHVIGEYCLNSGDDVLTETSAADSIRGWTDGTHLPRIERKPD
jgi:hypothetical protein